MAFLIGQLIGFSATTATNTLSYPLLISQRRSKTHTKQINRFKVSCNVAPAADDDDSPLLLPESQKLILPKTSLDVHNVDRRNLLLGLGGLYSTVNFTSSLPAAFAAPIKTPDISTCKDADAGIQDMKNAVRSRACCPPASIKPVKDFIIPQENIVRTRWVAHRGSTDNVDKYRAAIKAMRDLPDDHPHSFVQQAKIHCAYCNGGYTQIDSGFPEIDIQVHNCWLFFPYHRWYLYFYERILGKLINDPTFALPYWNWDNPTGMTIPPIFEGKRTDDDVDNPIFDAYREARHLPPEIVDLDYNGTDRDASCIEQIGINLSTMYKQMISNAPDAKSFFGGEYRARDNPVNLGDPTIGTIDGGCHTAIHRWVGDSRMPNNEDMGNFYSAGYDPVFFIHHTNVDRMWKLWKSLEIPGHTEPVDPDWLNASYVFYDENEELVRVYNKDCVKMENLNYEYERSEIPWLKGRPVPRSKKSKIASKSIGKVKKVQDVKFPVKLDQIVKVLVKRPAVNRTAADKAKANEMLLVKGIRFDGEQFVKFDVFVNDKEDGRPSLASESEFAGSFAQVPHGHMSKMLIKSAARFGLTELLEDIEAEDDEFVLVTLVPKAGCKDVTVAEIKIELVPIG